MIDDYRKEAADRLKEGLPPLPLTAKQTAELITLLKSPHIKDTEALMALFCHRVPSGVDQAAYIKAAYHLTGRLAVVLWRTFLWAFS